MATSVPPRRPAPAAPSGGRAAVTSPAAPCWISNWRRASSISRRGAAMPAETGFPRADVENDFQRARRHQVLARLAQRLRREPDDVNLILPFDEVVAALGMKGERSLGLQTIRLDT